MDMRETTGRTTIRSERRLFVASAALLVVAMLLGGQGDGSAFREGIIQLFALLVLLFAVGVGPASDARVVRAAKWVLVATVGLIVLHLIPLPYTIWAALTPVETAREVLADLALEGDWRPFTLDPSTGFDHLLLLIPPIAMFAAVLRMPPYWRVRLCMVLVAMAGISAAIGLLQYGSGTQALVFYEASHRGFGTGYFSNRNHQADLAVLGWLMAAGLVALPTVPTSRMSPAWRIAALALASLLFLLATLATGSRGGFLFAAFAALVVISMQIGGGAGRIVGAIVGVGAVGSIFAAISASSGSMLLAETLERFSAEDEARLEIWPQVIALLPDTMPLGAGIGSFVEYYRFTEPLELVGRKFVNSAHNEYLEIALEMGVPGLALVAAGIGVIGWAGFLALRRGLGGPEDYRRLQAAALAAIVVLVAHSSFDYPLRTTALAVCFALLCGLLMPKPLGSTAPGGSDAPGRGEAPPRSSEL